jgi:hypothetical protein
MRSVAALFYTVMGVVALVGSIAGVAALIWIMTRGHGERDDEDAARAYFEEHGRWPDEGS